MGLRIIKPPALRPGDTIGIVTPASPMLVEKLERGVDYLRSRGYRVMIGEHVYDSHGYLAGWDKDRINDLQAMFTNQEVKAIFSSRGGYGTPRMLDKINYELIRNHPKIFVGYSDVTALQLAIWQHCRLVTFSGPMAAVEMGTGIAPLAEHCLWTLLGGENSDHVFSAQGAPKLEVIRSGKARGILLGGCLSLLNSIIGTRHQPDFTGSILVLEDIGEQPYRVDRYLSQLRAAGILDQVNGILLGQFVDCAEKEGEPTLTLEEIFADYFEPLAVPVLKNFMYGHVPKKFTLPLGAVVEIDSSVPTVRLLEAAVQLVLI